MSTRVSCNSSSAIVSCCIWGGVLGALLESGSPVPLGVLITCLLVGEVFCAFRKGTTVRVFFREFCGSVIRFLLIYNRSDAVGESTKACSRIIFEFRLNHSRFSIHPFPPKKNISTSKNGNILLLIATNVYGNVYYS